MNPRCVSPLASLALLTAFATLSNALHGNADETHSASNGAAAAERPPGDWHVFQAHRLTKTARDVADYTKIVKMCEEGVHAGLSDDFDEYTRRLMSWAYNRRGEALARQGHEAMAMKDFELAIRHDDSRWRAWHNRGVSHAMQGAMDLAVGDFTRTLELNPEHANAWFNRGEVHYELGNLDDAVTDYSESIKLDPKEPQYRISRGHTYRQLGKLKEAAYDFTVAVRIKPHHAEALVNRGDLYTELGHWSKAVDDYRAAVQSDGEYGRAYLSSAWLMATCPDSQYRSAEGAVAAMQRAGELMDRSDHRFLDVLAAVQANAEDFAAAVKTVGAAIENAPETARRLYQSRLARYRQRQPYRLASPTIARAKPSSGVQPSNFQTPTLAAPE